MIFQRDARPLSTSRERMNEEETGSVRRMPTSSVFWNSCSTRKWNDGAFFLSNFNGYHVTTRVREMDVDSKERQVDWILDRTLLRAYCGSCWLSDYAIRKREEWKKFPEIIELILRSRCVRTIGWSIVNITVNGSQYTVYHFRRSGWLVHVSKIEWVINNW